MAQNGNLAVVQQVMRQRCWIGLTHHLVGEIANPAALESMAMDKVVAVSTFSPEHQTTKETESAQTKTNGDCGSHRIAVAGDRNKI